ncbi:DUF2975 domain-containing protein [Caulobacter sp. CCUG 60055]|uniref:DUF2975 domain-containing protein n=1 Tax=Caulobacter sp. CCUG 60055 TaxID=2100090 RepID=UPI001FA805DE|nr:DUF2975 domain-containing protein [Caulobacter sp. CCUG 60055]MBQ1543433.1 DUF2975 domain-containing protein [Caulobacteraceae bacterium]MCI3179672.1 DUF2975 domain-containing protein [Caulobacter sp. CCUG 60055]
MRALGPGSVSSLLKIILDVVYVALWIVAGAVLIGFIASGVLVANPDLLKGAITINGEVTELSQRGPSVMGAIAAGGLYVGGVLIIVGRLRRIFATLIAGDPFQPDNVRRLRVIGVMLALLELSRYVVAGLFAWLAPGVNKADAGVSLTAWFAVLVVFVLAEVFREGARLRREAELTI